MKLLVLKLLCILLVMSRTLIEVRVLQKLKIYVHSVVWSAREIISVEMRLVERSTKRKNEKTPKKAKMWNF